MTARAWLLGGRATGARLVSSTPPVGTDSVASSPGRVCCPPRVLHTIAMRKCKNCWCGPVLLISSVCGPRSVRHCRSGQAVSSLLYSTLLYSTLLYSTLLYSTLLYSTLLYSTLLYSTLLYSTLLSDARWGTTRLESPTRMCVSTTDYTFTPCVRSFTSPGMDTR